MSQSPAIDVIGVGLSSGDVLIYDIRADELVIKMHMEGGDARALSFRSGMFQIGKDPACRRT
jgi:U3 small nucleolar RNA-associated protein 21